MELDYIAYIDIVQICAVILAPGKLLTRSSLLPAPPPLLFYAQRGEGQEQILRTCTLQQHGGSNNTCGACGGGIGW